MQIIRAKVVTYSATAHTCAVQPNAGPGALLDCDVVQNCPGSFLVADREVAVLIYPDAKAVVLGPYGAAAADWAFAGQIHQQTNVIRAVFTKDGIPDNVATAIFKILTTNEAGDYDGGGYSCFVHALIGHIMTASSGTGATTKSFTAQFCRAMLGTGSGVNSAVSEVVETASAATNPSNRDIGTVTMTAVENGEYEVQVKFQIDCTGTSTSTAQIAVIVELVCFGFLTPPVLAAA